MEERPTDHLRHDARAARPPEAVAHGEGNLQLIIDTIPVLVWSAKTDGSATFFNRYYLDFVGLSQEEMTGWGWTAAIHPDDMAALAESWAAIRASEAPAEAEARLRRHDGAYHWFLLRAVPLRDEAGRVVGWHGVNTDIEDRRQAEAGLRRAYDSVADAQRLSKTGSFISDLRSDQHQWSEETFRIFDFEPAAPVTLERMRAAVHPDDQALFDAAISRGLRGGDADFAFRILTPAGASKHVRGRAHIVEQADGRTMAVGALQDVTASKLAEEALERARSELAHVARVSTLSTLTASIAHEVNQPLSGIITNASTCLRMLDADPPNLEGVRETARRSIRDGRRASDVVTRLRAMFANRAFTREPLDLNEAAREVLAMAAGDLQMARVIVQPEFAKDLPTIVGDRVQLQQVILNLLRNAVDAMAAVEGRTRLLTIRTERDGADSVRLQVRDAGVGLTPEGRDKLFMPFQTTKSGGMGIGLSVSRSIIERHEGRLWADANDGPGTTFSFCVPVAAAAQ